MMTCPACEAEEVALFSWESGYQALRDMELTAYRSGLILLPKQWVCTLMRSSGIEAKGAR
jgi:hypothetical protein